MKIIILGAGQVGTSVAESLVSEANDITVVDTDGARLRLLQDRLDLRTVTGSAAHPPVLKSAGIDDADMLIAVTQSDETNLVACKIAAHMYNVPTRIARIRAPQYLANEQLFAPECFAVDYAICPEQLITEYLVKLVQFPEALQVLEFADGRVSLVAVRAFEGGPLVGHQLQDIRTHMPNVDVRVAAIFRGDRPIVPEGTTRVHVGDEVFCLAASQNIRKVMQELRRMDKPAHRIMIAGGGNIGLRLARALEGDYTVKILEHSKRRCEELSTRLEKTLVLQADVTDESLLEAENVDEMDLFVAVTNDDETNILSAVMAKNLGCKRNLCLINSTSYPAFTHAIGIDAYVNPRAVTVSRILRHVRRGRIRSVHSLQNGAAELIEAEALQTSPLVGKPLRDLDLPDGVRIGAVYRKRAVIVPTGATQIQAGDRVVIFAVAERVRLVEQMFRVSLEFF